MISYLVKWAMASLVMPILVLLFGRFIQGMIVLVFWPGSIVLMSLGAEKKPLGQVVYVWAIAVGLNILLYLFVGLVVYYVTKLIKN